jgi:hypothetical protein
MLPAIRGSRMAASYLPLLGRGNPSRVHAICGVGLPAELHFRDTAGPGCRVCSMKLYRRMGGASETGTPAPSVRANTPQRRDLPLGPTPLPLRATPSLSHKHELPSTCRRAYTCDHCMTAHSKTHRPLTEPICTWRQYTRILLKLRNATITLRADIHTLKMEADKSSQMMEHASRHMV